MPFFQGEQEAEMQKEVLKEPTYVEELLTLFRSNLGKEELLEKISDYHESDIADAMEQMTPEERKKLYPLLGEEYIAEILPIPRMRQSICRRSTWKMPPGSFRRWIPMMRSMFWRIWMRTLRPGSSICWMMMRKKDVKLIFIL